jgi:hypothetical protein
MHFVYQTNAQGGIDLLKVRDNGTTRTILENDPSFMEWCAAGNVPATIPYMAPVRDLEAEKASKLAAVQAKKCAVRDGGFLVDAVRFDSDMPAQLAYMSLAMELMSNPTYTTDWKASGNFWVTMDATGFAKVRAGIKAHIEACFARQAQLDYLVQNAASVEELDAISIDTGWPS